MKATREGKDCVSETGVIWLFGKDYCSYYIEYTPETRVEAGRPDRKVLQ